MRLDINTSVPFPEDDSDIRAAQDGAMLGAKLARMRFDFPDQMLARVAVDNGDGTYDCDRPGTLIYMSAVPVDSPLLTVPILVGATVVIRFYGRDRSKPRIVDVAGGIEPLEAFAMVWSRITGNPRSTFSQGLGGSTFLDVSTAVPGVLIATRGGDLALDWPLSSVLLCCPIGESNALLILAGKAPVGSTPSPVLGIVYAYDLEGSLLWSSEPHDGETVLASDSSDNNPFLPPSDFTLRDGPRFQYDEELNILIVGSHIRQAGTGLGGNRKVRFTGLSPEDGSILWSDYIPGPVNAGMGVYQGVLVKVARELIMTGKGAPINLNTSTPVTPSALTEESWSWTGYQLSLDAAPVKLWQWDPFTLFTAALYPVMYTSHRSQFAPTGAPVFVGTRVYGAVAGKYGLPQCNPTGTFQASLTEAYILPENFPSLPFDRQLGFFGTSSGINVRTMVSADSARLEAYIVGLGLQTGLREATYTFPALDADSSAHYVVDETSFSFAAPSGFFTAGSFSKWASRSQSAAGGLLPNHYLDSLAASRPTSPDAGDPFYPSTSIFFGPAVGGINVGAGSYGSGQGEIGEYDITDGPISTAGDGFSHLTTDADLTIQRLFPHYLYWPYSAGIHFEPCPFVHTEWNNSNSGLPSRGDESNAAYSESTNDTSSFAKTPCSPSLTVDADGNLYGAWIQPYGIVSARCFKTGNIKASFYCTANTLPDNYSDPFASPYTGGSIAITWFGIPRRYTMYRGFQASWTSGLQLRWVREVTEWIEDTENSSGLSLPHAGCTLRMLPSTAGVFVLRAEHVDTFSSLPITYNTARFAGYTKTQCRSVSGGAAWPGVVTVGDHEGIVWARVVLELLDSASGAVKWRRVLWDPVVEGISTPSIVHAASLSLSEGKNPYVVGSVSVGLATWGSVGNLGTTFGRYGISSSSTIAFSADAQGTVKTATGTAAHPSGNGINLTPDNKPRALESSVLVDGALYYTGRDTAASKWRIYKMGNA